MHAIMRRWILWCVLCLLPWRLWAADLMALRACHDQVATVAAVDDGHHHHQHHQDGVASPMTDDTAPHAQHGDPTPLAHGGSHVGCTLCDLCHNPMGAALPLTWSAPPTCHAWPLLRLDAPPQAAWVPELRPPIA